MRDNIHPNYRPSTIRCACGSVIESRSTRGDFQVEVCAACHPFFTGKQKLLDTEGRIEKFRKKWGEKAGKATKA